MAEATLDAASGYALPEVADRVAARPRMLYSLEQTYVLAERSLALETYYYDQLAIASAPDGATTSSLPEVSANELAASLDLLRHPLPLTLRTNEASSRGGVAAITALDAALGSISSGGGSSNSSGCGPSSSGGTGSGDPGWRRLQPIPWLANAWQVSASPSKSYNSHNEHFSTSTEVMAAAAAAAAGASTVASTVAPVGADDAAIRNTSSLVDANRVTELLIRLQKCGEVAQQEHGSMLPAHCLAPVCGHHAVLDLCAAPGSKTLQLLDAMHASASASAACLASDSKSRSDEQRPLGLLIANEIEAKRCTKLRDRASSQPASCLVTTTCDAREFPSLSVAKDGDSNVFPKLRFDRILCDVPCSGDGALRKSPLDLPLWQPQSALGEHPRQLAILMRGLELLAPGGKLVYSTCSLNPIENEAVVAAALDASRAQGLRVRLLPLPSPLFAATATATTTSGTTVAADMTNGASGCSSSGTNNSGSSTSGSSTSGSNGNSSSRHSNSEVSSSSSCCPRWEGWGLWGVPHPLGYTSDALTRVAAASAKAYADTSSTGAGAAAAAAASDAATASTTTSETSISSAAPSRMFTRFEDVPQELRKGGGTKKAPLLPSMFPPQDLSTRNLLRERCGRIMPSKSANCGGFFVAIFTRDTKTGPAATEWQQVWAPKSSSSSSSSSPSSLLSPPPPPAASSSSSDDVTTNTPNAKAQSKVEGAAEAGRGAVTVGGGAAEGSGKRRAREAYLKSNDEGDVGNSEVLGAAALEVEKGEVEPKGKQQRSRKRNKLTQTRVDVERRPCFLPLTSVDQTTTQEIANFFGFKESGSANSGSGSGDGSSCGSASTENVNMKENEHDTVLSSSSTSSSPSSVLPSLAVGSYHKDRSMIYTCSHGAFALQAHASLHVASFGEPFVNRMSSEAAHWWPVQEARWRPCHEAASIFGAYASKRRLWLRKPSLASLSSSSSSALPLLNPVTTTEETVGDTAAGEVMMESSEVVEHAALEAATATATATASLVEAAAHWKQDPWRTLLTKRHLPASVLRDLATSGDLQGLGGCCNGDMVALRSNGALNATVSDDRSNTSDNGLPRAEGSLVPGGVVVSFFDDGEELYGQDGRAPSSSSSSLSRCQAQTSAGRPWLVGLLETGGGLLLLAEGDVLRRHLLG